MSKREILQLREKLLRDRKEIFERLRSFKSDWQSLQERDVELEEEAQKSPLKSLISQLDEFGSEEIGEIDLALLKMVSGNYGFCEGCRKPISLKRLKILPGSRLCLECSRNMKDKPNRLMPAREVITSGEVPSEYRSLSNKELEVLILERLHQDGSLDLEELEVSCRNDVVYLEGVVPNEAEHGILLKILTDVLGFESVIDHLQICQLIWERVDRASGNLAVTVNAEERLLYNMDEFTDDLVESIEREIPYILPERPQSDEE